MLIEFSVANFRSIKERQTISMVANNAGGIIETGFNSAPTLLEKAAIYGPNGAGKSNLILAMEFFQEFVMESAKGSQQGESIDVTPFLFSKKTQQEPSEFEIVFIHDGYLFQYGFIVDSKIVYEEWLYATPESQKRQKKQTWFERYEGEIHTKKELKGQQAIWKKATRDNALFLSTAVNLNSEDLKKPFEWIQHFLRVITIPERISPNYTIKLMTEDKRKKDVIKFLQGLDASFDDIVVVKREFSEADVELPKDMPKSLKQEIIKELSGKTRVEIFTRHEMEDGEFYLLNASEESEGTRRLIAFAGPILDVLEGGLTLIADEINNSIHPHALKGVIQLFEDKKINTKNAQLIFTTHDTSIMNMLKRDQVWLVHKEGFGTSVFTSVSDFQGKPDELIEKRYITGRYGALPNIKDLV